MSKVKMNIIFNLILLVLCVLISEKASLARDLNIGVAEFPPFKYLDSNGKLVGHDTEIVEEVVRRMGDKPIFNVAPWARILYEAESNSKKYDFIYTFTQTQERDKLYYFSDPISYVRDVFYKRKDKNISWNNLSDLYKFILGIGNGYKYAPNLNEAIEKKHFSSIVVESGLPEIRNLVNLENKKVDIFICEVSVCQYYLNNNHETEIFKHHIDFIDKTVGEVRAFRAGFPKYLQDPIKNDLSLKLRDKFNLELKNISKEYKEKVSKKYRIN